MFDRLHSRRIALSVIVAASLACGASVARAEMMTFKATLDGKSQVPPNSSAATGQATFTYDTATKELKWTVTYSGMSQPATAAHIHGPAEPGKNAGVLIPFTSAGSPISGTKMLTDAQAADMMAGKWYVNVHTAANPGGEIRGNITK